MGYHRKLSLTGQWQFLAAQWTCLKQRIMHIYGHTTYGHMSLTTVNDKNLWTKPKKVSLTSVNDKKIVIDHGQWQKKLSLTERYLYRDIKVFMLPGSWLWTFISLPQAPPPAPATEEPSSSQSVRMTRSMCSINFVWVAAKLSALPAGWWLGCTVGQLFT